MDAAFSNGGKYIYDRKRVLFLVPTLSATITLAKIWDILFQVLIVPTPPICFIVITPLPYFAGRVLSSTLASYIYQPPKEIYIFFLNM